MAMLYKMATAEDVQDADLHAYEDGVRDGMDRAMQSPWIKRDPADLDTYPPHPGRYIGLWKQKRKGSEPYRAAAFKTFVDDDGCIDYCKVSDPGDIWADSLGTPDYWTAFPG